MIIHEPVKYLSNSEIAGLNALCVAELAEKGYSGMYVMSPWESEVIICRITGDAVGMICYELADKDTSLHIMLGYVKPFFRRNGVYTAMWNKLIDIAKEKKVLRITGGVAVKNQAMREFCKKQGRVETMLTVHYTL